MSKLTVVADGVSQQQVDTDGWALLACLGGSERRTVPKFKFVEAPDKTAEKYKPMETPVSWQPNGP